MMMRVTVAIALAVLASAGGRQLGAQTPGDSDEIRAVIEGYIVGWREGDVERLANVFATEEGVVLWRTGEEGAEELGGMTFAEILARGRRPNEHYGDEWSISSLDIVDDQLAVARVEISRSGGSYVDYLVLYKLAEGWRIVTKTFVVR